MNVEFLTNLPSIQQIAGDWRDLYKVCGQSPFQNPYLHEVWWERLVLRTGLHQGLYPLVAVGRSDDGRLDAVASFAIERRRGLRILGWAGEAAFDYPDALIRNDTDAPAFWNAIRGCKLYDVAVLRNVRSDSRTHSILDGGARRYAQTETIYAIVGGEHGRGEDWLASLPRSVRAEHRDKVRQIVKQFGPLRLRRIETHEEIPGVINRLVALKAKWAQARNTETVYQEDGIVDYFHDFASQALDDGTLHLTTLEAGSACLAVHLGFESGDGFYYYVSTYDIDHAKLSPGRVHMNLLVMQALDNGLRFDFLRGEGEYKARLGRVSRKISHFVFARGLLGTVALNTYLRRQNKDASVAVELA